MQRAAWGLLGLLLFTPGVGGQQPAPTTVAWDLGGAWHDGATWELETASDGIVPCGSPTVTATDRRCVATFSRSVAQSVRLRGTQAVCDHDEDPGTPAQGPCVGGWSGPASAPAVPQGQAPGALTITWAGPVESGGGGGTMAAPTFVSENETAWNSTTTPKTTASFSVLASDFLVALAGMEGNNGGGSQDMGLTSGGSLTWTNREEEDDNDNAKSEIRIDTATVDSDKSMTTSVARSGTGTAMWFGQNTLQFRGSDGIGATNSTNNGTGSGAPSLTITTTGDNSAIAVIVADWNAADGTSRTWRTVNGTAPSAANGFEVTYFRDSSHYTVYIAYYPDAGAAGAKTVGLSAPTGQRYVIAAVEILGTAGGGNVSISVPQGNLALSATVPSRILAHLPSPPQANLALSAVAPTRLQNHAAAPPQGALALSAVAPTALQAHAASPPQANLTLSALAPGVTASQTISPPQGDLVLSALAPTRLEASHRLPAQGNLVLSALAPTVNVAGGVVAIEVPAGALAFSTAAPTRLEASFRLPAPGNLVLSRDAPARVVNHLPVIPARNLVLSAAAPTRLEAHRPAPPGGNLVLSTTVPGVFSGTFLVTVPTGSLTFTGTAPTVTQAFSVIPIRRQQAGQAPAMKRSWSGAAPQIKRTGLDGALTTPKRRG